MKKADVHLAALLENVSPLSKQLQFPEHALMTSNKTRKMFFKSLQDVWKVSRKYNKEKNDENLSDRQLKFYHTRNSLIYSQ